MSVRLEYEKMQATPARETTEAVNARVVAVMNKLDILIAAVEHPGEREHGGPR